MSNQNRKVKAVSFSLDDEYEIGLFNYINRMKNFSGYVKRLIDNDMRFIDKSLTYGEVQSNITEENITNEDVKAMSSFF